MNNEDVVSKMETMVVRVRKCEDQEMDLPILSEGEASKRDEA